MSRETKSEQQIGTSVLFENDRIRVWQLKLNPGEGSSFHRHLHDYVFIYASPSELQVTVAGSAPQVASCDEGFVQYWEVGMAGIAPHGIRNVGDRIHQEFIVEFLGPSRSQSSQEPQTNGRSRQ